MVALLAEGVDRNWNMASTGDDEGVALLAEGVDRNLLDRYFPTNAASGRPPRGGRG